MFESTAVEKVPAGAPEIPEPISIPAYGVDREERESQALVEYWRVLRKRRWTVLSILLLVITTALIGTLKQRPVYRSTAVLQIDKENPNILSFKDAFEINTSSDDYLETAYNVLQNENLVMRVIDKLHLERIPEFAEKPSLLRRMLTGGWLKPAGSNPEPAWGQNPADPAYEDTIKAFLRRLTIDPVRRSRLVRISFDSFDPSLAAQVVNTLATNYIDQNLEAKWDATQKASEWLSQQLVSLKAKLEKSSEELQSYAQANSIVFLDEKQSMTAKKLEQLQEEATRAEADAAQKESIYNQIKGGDLSSVPGIQENKLYQELSVKLADMRRDYSELTATFTPEYPKVKRLKSQMDEVERSLEKERSSFANQVTTEYRVAATRKRIIDQAVAQQTREFNSIAQKSVQYNILKREADTNRQLYEGLLERVKEASVSAGMRASNIRIVSHGRVPLQPATPRPLLNAALALIAGLSLGAGMAFFQEYLDDSLKTPDDVQRYLRLSALGMIPSANATGRGKLGYGYAARKSLAAGYAAKGQGTALHSEIIGLDGQAPLSEAYRSLRTSVLLSASGRPPRSILITSGQPGEGKTTTTVNLAIALAQLGGRAVVIESDMRRPRIGSLLDIAPTSKGLSTLLTGQFTLDQVLVQSKIPGLYAVCCGPLPPNPAELMSSPPMHQLLEELQKRFEYVLLDSPPVLNVADARILATQVEAVILVTHGGSTPREIVNHAKDNLLRVNANVIGVVLNNLDFSGVGHDYYRYYGGYGDGYGYASRSKREELASQA
jgi:succinoglycan biosynthesis transport protein ExoP